MQTEAVFENIATRIIEEIDQANHSIYIAVAWFTNKSIIKKLQGKAKEGCQINIIVSNDSINENSILILETLKRHKVKVYKIGNGETELMHNKFCVIDESTVISGSYNWSYKAENNFENIVINYENNTLAQQFIKQFNSLVAKYYPAERIEETTFPIELVIKRLEVIKNLILLEDFEDLAVAVNKLQPFQYNLKIKEIIAFIQCEEYGSAMNAIHNFIKDQEGISIWVDPEIAGIKLEIKILESQISAFDNEKMELEKLLSDFQHRHMIELGEIIIELLRLRKIKYKEHPKEAESEKDFNDYNQQFELEKQKSHYVISEEEKKVLKKNFRKATNLCHPDKVSEEQKEEAQRVFIALKKAYDENDIAKVNQILTDLENNKSFNSAVDTISEKLNLKSLLKQLREKKHNLEQEIQILKHNETYEEIVKIENWDAYFKKAKLQLKNELEKLTIEVLG